MRRVKRSKAARKKGPSPQESAELQQVLQAAVSHHQAGRLDQAESLYQQVLQAQPAHADANHLLGLVAHQTGNHGKAVQLITKAARRNSGVAVYHYNLAIVLQEEGRMDEAIECYRKALEIKPDYADAYNNMAIVLQERGRMDEAIECYRKALEVKPGYAEAYRHLAAIKRHSEYDDDIRAMEELYASPDISDEQRMHLAFGLGKVFEDLRQYEKAFGFFAEGNALNRKTCDVSIKNHAEYFDKLKRAFDASLFSQCQGSGLADETPIFILGMPRSGTSLVEQILASHPQVHGAGELENMRRIALSSSFWKNGVTFPKDVKQNGLNELERLGAEYIGTIRKHSEEARFITDKAPANFFYIGLIKLILPNSKIIHCRRDPVDNCLSMFKNYFVNKRHDYVYEQVELGQYYNLYLDLMEHWHSVLSGFIHDIQYEEMVSGQEQKTRELLEYCGLDWDDACLEFYKTDRRVRTISAEQVRRPIYKDSVEAWKRYEKQLAPLLETLNRGAP